MAGRHRLEGADGLRRDDGALQAVDARLSLHVGLEWYDLDPGDCVELVHPRYGLDRRKNVRVDLGRAELLRWHLRPGLVRAERSRLHHRELRMSSARIVPVNFFDSDHSTISISPAAASGFPETNLQSNVSSDMLGSRRTRTR
jgi:hypothetical protein